MADTHGKVSMNRLESPEIVLAIAVTANKTAAMKQSRLYLEICFGIVFTILFWFHDTFGNLRIFSKTNFLSNLNGLTLSRRLISCLWRPSRRVAGEHVA